MFARSGWFALAFAAGLLLACAGPGLPDGSTCDVGERCVSGDCNAVGFDCSSGTCRERGYCPGSRCSDDGDCEADWTCQHVLVDEASFLGILDKDDYAWLCVPHCGACPDYFSCDGTACKRDPDWAPEGAPVIQLAAPTEIGVGMPASLSASATSPTGAEIATYLWHFHGGEQASGEAVEHAFTADQAIVGEFSENFHATVEVTDVQGNVATKTAEIHRCGAAGESCEDSYDCCPGLFTCTPTADPNDDPAHATCEPASQAATASRPLQ
jgi:hypothetical protein